MSLLLTSNDAATAVAASGTVALGTPIHGCGRIRLIDNAIVLADRGYYFINVSATIAVTGTSALSIQLYADGEEIPGAVASATPSAAGALVNLDIPWVIRKECGCKPTKITVVSSAAGTVNKMIVSVKS